MTSNQALASLLSLITGSSTQVGFDGAMPLSKRTTDIVRVRFATAAQAQAFATQNFSPENYTIEGSTVSFNKFENMFDFPLPYFTIDGKDYYVTDAKLISGSEGVILQDMGNDYRTDFYPTFLAFTPADHNTSYISPQKVFAGNGDYYYVDTPTYQLTTVAS